MDQQHEESQVIKQLQRFRPQPSKQAYGRLAQAPWVRQRQHARKTGSSQVVRLIAITCLAMMTIGAVIWATPPLRSLAQEIINQLFNRMPSDTRVIEYEAGPPVATTPLSVAQTFLSVEEAEAQTGIDIREPQIDIKPYVLTGVTVNHETQSAWLIYNAPGRYLSIVQRTAALGWLDDGLVGASAQVEVLEFEVADGTIATGEYIAGGWRPTSKPETQADNGSVREPAVWTDETPQRRLRWRDTQFVYEMVTFGGDGSIPRRDLMRADMVEIAASMR